MIRKLAIIIIFFYILALLQTSFLVHFSINGMVPNLILISALLINFFEDPKKKDGILSAFIGGFFLDVFSENIFGLKILILTGTACFIKLMLNKYVRFPFFKKRF
ncbi:rod shape-determining protein MreD [Candidatus Parcubacteria bacterium]|nr:rod shape-determining protein MreD [Candidatus Parcubacteria bacterium]